MRPNPEPRVPPTRTLATAALVCATLTVFGAACGASPAVSDSVNRTGPTVRNDCRGNHWVGVWAASPSDATTTGAGPIGGRTVRTVISPLGAGSILRVHLSNRLGSEPFIVRTASVAKQSRNAGIRAGTLRVLRFDGKRGVTIDAHGTAVSDPVRLGFRALDHLSVSLYMDASSTGIPTKHFDGRQTSYLTAPGAGDQTTDQAGAFGDSTTVRYLVSGVDSWALPTVGAVVAFGDSITDGYQSQRIRLYGIDRDVRYPDFLARRLARAKLRQLTVLNAGIGGNRILQGPLLPAFGPKGLSRLNPDAIRQAGVRTVIVLEGINDIDQTNARGPTVIRGLTAIINRLERADLRVLVGTLLPNGGFALSRVKQHSRTVVNRWIRRQHRSDGMIDFDRALRDPERPARLLERYDSGDHLHPSSRGYAAMAAAVPLGQLRAPCTRR